MVANRKPSEEAFLDRILDLKSLPEIAFEMISELRTEFTETFVKHRCTTCGGRGFVDTPKDVQDSINEIIESFALKHDFLFFTLSYETKCPACKGSRMDEKGTKILLDAYDKWVRKHGNPLTPRGGDEEED